MTERGLMVKQKLLALGKKQNDVVVELNRRGVRASKTTLSDALNCPRCPSEHRIAEAASEIVLDWEHEARADRRRKKKEA